MSIIYLTILITILISIANQELKFTFSRTLFVTDNPSIIVTIMFEKQLTDDTLDFSLIDKNEYSKCTKHNTYFNCNLRSYGVLGIYPTLKLKKDLEI